MVYLNHSLRPSLLADASRQSSMMSITMRAMSCLDLRESRALRGNVASRKRS